MWFIKEIKSYNISLSQAAFKLKRSQVASCYLIYNYVLPVDLYAKLYEFLVQCFDSVKNISQDLIVIHVGNEKRLKVARFKGTHRSAHLTLMIRLLSPITCFCLQETCTQLLGVTA